MSDYSIVAKRYSLYTIILIIVFLVIAQFAVNKSFYFGLALGAVFSLLNLLSTYRQVKVIGEMVTGGTVAWTFGTVSRIVTAVIAVFIAMQFPAYFDMTGVIIGLMITYVFILIEPIFYVKQLRSN
ncbi:ATP synthase subunit I [Bacillus shivajii]|uniref:ATP synthase subunit I n=1 Tax=Bacillus shivajii TaxID=1983719 RepID=UPI001CFB906F|nr:ATP synthase subunit I [Bacillus shivajii]UCZ53024.1 ATP synthase subunit I [Bacillus shivajii]